MARFAYRAKKGPKEEITGYVEAENKNVALHILTSQGLYPFSIHQEDADHSAVKKNPFLRFARISIRDISIFTRQLSDLLEAGLPLLKALTVLHKQTSNRLLKRVISDLRDTIQDGSTLSDSLKKHPRIFSSLYVSMVKSGETSGSLENVLLRLAEFQESQDELNSTVSRAMAYPALMALVGLITIFVLITFVIPKIVSMFQDLNQALPIPTVILLNISNFVRNFWWILIGLVLLVYFTFARMFKTEEGKLMVDQFKLKIPVAGQLTLRAEIARFARTLSTLLSNGVPILEAMGVVIDIMENEILKRDARLAQREVREGSNLADGLNKGAYFPVFVTNMIAIGEESGTLEKALLKVAMAYEREVDKTIKVMTSLLEPLMILTVGLVIGFIVIAMLLPIFEISFITG
ncbi:MAG: type II secretion system F family protein [Candidatus Omnitrophica bacterium]|nr:type II secretion system F family protein [Candidatus Omnitrophota bacterium]